ncbi:MAG: RNA-directed DNA polymerase [Phocaeicola sp.]
MTKTFSTSKYVIKKKVEGGKLREIYSLPYFPDRVVQHALLQVIGPRLEKSFIRDTFQSIKGRGTSDARKRVSRFIKINRPTHYLQLDISKYYPSINNSKLKQKIRSVIKCPDTLHLLDNIISSCEGLPIGNYTSQVLGNYYLTDFDWFIKQQLKVKGYFRYCDDLVFFGTSSKELMDIKILVEKYL